MKKALSNTFICLYLWLLLDLAFLLVDAFGVSRLIAFLQQRSA
jgi:hypothetical protein